jgi:hypothetical protein
MRELKSSELVAGERYFRANYLEVSVESAVFVSIKNFWLTWEYGNGERFKTHGQRRGFFYLNPYAAAAHGLRAACLMFAKVHSPVYTLEQENDVLGMVVAWARLHIEHGFDESKFVESMKARVQTQT